MQRITLAPIPSATGDAKAVQKPDSHASALKVAAAKEVLGAEHPHTKQFMRNPWGIH